MSSQVSVENLSISEEISTSESAVTRTISNFSANMCDFNDHSLEEFLNISPIEKNKLYSEKQYGVKKLDESYAALDNKFRSQFGILPESTYRKISQDYRSMIAKLKELYNAETNTSIKNKLLSFLPDSWEISLIQSEFNCSRTKAVNLKQKLKNIELEADQESNENSDPIRSSGNQLLNLDVRKLVIDFYESEENSKQLAGMKDFKSVKNSDGVRSRVQKKLILCNLKELYQNFKGGGKDEIIALESIYTSDELSYNQNDDQYQCSLKIFISLPEGFYLLYKDDHASMPKIESIESIISQTLIDDK
ncbi:uncharacterized protein LOC130678392 [Microplitis mediator]|uniref:uncharacterized protein LOC130678391 n=1 Tax=Microplitis mediator TaxID=375433 RepID=UPI0025569BAA|nr:uncharacterized protein LOC130678391 [Microplitis mediator]XP_057341526.1 uncharacterized protein LOC130678392 [Microplitis mediator]